MLVLSALALVVLAGFTLMLVQGRSFISPGDIVRILLGEDLGGANFTVLELRLPRAVMCVVAGLSFGLGGAAFQTMLRNPLASPDIIGISAGASAAAVFAIIVLRLDGPLASAFAVVAGLGVALFIFLLSFRRGGFGARLILSGIGVSAMLDSFISYILAKAPAWDLAEALRWLTGSVNGASWNQIGPALVALGVLGPLLLSRARDLEAMRLGEETAAALGVQVIKARLLIILPAVGLIAFATAAAGPIAFVAFLAGPIAARVLGPNGSILLPGALVGAIMVLGADFCGQYAFGSRYPVGVITGALGAPYLIYLIIRSNQVGRM